MSDQPSSRGHEIAESIEADFVAGTWTFKPLGDFQVCAGLYLIVPVKDCQQADDYMERIASSGGVIE